MALRGAPELRRRLRAIRQVFKPVGREWADLTAENARRNIRRVGAVDTGRTVASIRRRNASQRKATVVGHYPVNFIDAGVKAHDIVPKRVTAMKFESGGETVFARKVHKRAIPARPFKVKSAQDALAKVDILRDLIKLWNEAA